MTRFLPSSGNLLFQTPFSVTTLAANRKIILTPFHPATYQLFPTPQTRSPVLPPSQSQAILKPEKPPTGLSNSPQGRFTI
jgi:hypothetical protein